MISREERHKQYAQKFTEPFAKDIMFWNDSNSIEFSEQNDFWQKVFTPVSFKYLSFQIKQDNFRCDENELKTICDKFQFVFTSLKSYERKLFFTNDVWNWQKVREEMKRVFEIGNQHKVVYFWK